MVAMRKGIVFVATFFFPSIYIVSLTKYLPLKFLLRLLFASYFIRKYLLGARIPYKLFQNVLATISDIDLKNRLYALEINSESLPLYSVGARARFHLLLL